MAESAAEMEQRAERAVRRGELLLALETYEAILAEHPEEERVRQRMESVRGLLQPSELVNRRRAEPAEDARGPQAGTLSEAELGEMHASAGRFADALKWYQRALEQSPENDLVRERLEELHKLAPPGARADLAYAERLEAPAARVLPLPEASRAEASRSARAAEAAFGPLDPATPARPLPDDPVALLRELLERIQSGRRGPVAGA